MKGFVWGVPLKDGRRSSRAKCDNRSAVFDAYYPFFWLRRFNCMDVRGRIIRPGDAFKFDGQQWAPAIYRGQLFWNHFVLGILRFAPRSTQSPVNRNPTPLREGLGVGPMMQVEDKVVRSGLRRVSFFNRERPLLFTVTAGSGHDPESE